MRFFNVEIFVFLCIFLFSCNAGILSPPRGESEIKIREENGKRILQVDADADLQKAIEIARGGDIIELHPRAIYKPIKLANKDTKDFIVIKTALDMDSDCLKQKNALAKIATSEGHLSAVTTATAAHHYRFVCVGFIHVGTDYVHNLVYIGTDSNKVNDLPHDFEFDRCYFKSSDRGITRRGLAANGINIVVQNSSFEGFGYPQEETQGIAGWTGSRNIKILNNYIEGGAENIMFGGSDPASPELIPQDIEVRGNHLNKPSAWKGRVTTKCLFELKNAKRVIFAENYMENNWDGSAFRITVRNQDGKAPFSTIEDVSIYNNVIVGSGDGINILGKDDQFPSQTLRGLKITNNLFLKLGGSGFFGSGYFVQISDGEDILIANNTVFNEGNIVTFHGAMPRKFVVRDNIVGHGLYGIHGHSNIRSLTNEFRNNVIVNNRKINESDKSFPSGNLWVESYGSLLAEDYTVLSNFKQKIGREVGFNPALLPRKLVDFIVKPKTKPII